MSHVADAVAALASLKASGAEPFDPVRLHFLQALARRTQDHQGAVKRRLDDKLAQALATYHERMTQASTVGARTDSRRVLNATSGLQGLQGLRQPVPGSALAQLAQELTQMPPGHPSASADRCEANLDAPPELKSVRYFRETWSRLSVDKQIATALAQGPQNAGPLNSDQLVLRSLGVMRDIAPDYLHRFISYLDTLLWLDQADASGAPKNPANGGNAKKKKTGRASVR